MVMSEPSTISAATMANAAELGSPGTAITCGLRLRRPSTRMVRTPSSPVSISIVAPKAASIRSVWSREGTGSITVVTPPELSAASRIADLTCAEATGSRYSIGTSISGPRIVAGSRSSDRVSACTPMRRSGSSTRPIGRRTSEASPVKVVVKAWPPAIPSVSRAPVPELPKSTTCSGSMRPPTPRPAIRQAPGPVWVTAAPKAPIAAAVASTSSLSRSPSIAVSPTASAPSISARCEMDLSPGGRMVPASGPDRLARSCVAASAAMSPG